MASLQKKANRGFHGYPIGTVVFHGPDNRRASKVSVGIVADESDEVVQLERWFSTESDVRSDPEIAHAIVEFLRLHGARSIVMVDRIMGCAHEEGIEYPVGQSCPMCPYWAGRDRFTHERIQ
jgi:hypothetical protein